MVRDTKLPAFSASGHLHFSGNIHLLKESNTDGQASRSFEFPYKTATLQFSYKVNQAC